MKKEFVPYELAVKLKELGFDEPCFATWSGETLDMSLQIPSDDYFTKAPTFSQAFRWFREKHELECCLKMNYDILNSRVMYLNGKEVCRFIIGDKKWGLMDKDSEAYKIKPGYYEKTYTYEEAELSCLIKLIEIVKQQNQNKIFTVSGRSEQFVCEHLHRTEYAHLGKYKCEDCGKWMDKQTNCP